MYREICSKKMRVFRIIFRSGHFTIVGVDSMFSLCEAVALNHVEVESVFCVTEILPNGKMPKVNVLDSEMYRNCLKELMEMERS